MCTALVKAPLSFSDSHGPHSPLLPQGHFRRAEKWEPWGESFKDIAWDPQVRHQRQFTWIKGKNVKTSILFNFYIQHNYPRLTLYVSHHWHHQVHMSDASCHLEPQGVHQMAMVCVSVCECVTMPFIYLFSEKFPRSCCFYVTVEVVFKLYRPI